MVGYTFKDLACEVLASTGRPMSAEQIWYEAVNLSKAEKVGSQGKTPERSIQAQLYTDIRDNSDSRFQQLSKHPVLFGLTSLNYSDDALENATDNVQSNDDDATERSESTGSSWKERELHPILATFVRSDPHFQCHTKTIFHEGSARSHTKLNQWLHPDMVGIYYPFSDFEECTRGLQEALKKNPYKLFSFELKKKLRTSNLRECFFQAVSNSSWAHEGYLVAADISSDSDFLDDLQRLSNAFGIGIIRLDIEHVEQSEILFQARTRSDLDWATVDRLASINPDFREFLVEATKATQIELAFGSYERILEDEEYDAYLREHHMIP